MSDVIDAVSALRASSEELDRLSKALHMLEAEFEHVQDAYEQFMTDFEVGLWIKHADHGAKLPPATIRVKLAHKAMDPVLLASHVGLARKRERLMKDIGLEKAKVDAQRSILSALKTEMEASSHR